MSSERAMHEPLWVMGPEEEILEDLPEPAWPYFLDSFSSALPASYIA